MRPMLPSLLFVAALSVFPLAGPACSGPTETHACDAGTPTCESTLAVLLADPRIEFSLSLKDDVGLDLTVECPDLDTGSNQAGDYTWVCGAGRVTVSTFLHFGDTLEIQLEQSPVVNATPSHQKGVDYCGNTCTTSTVQL